MVKLSTCIKMISMFFVSAILAKQGSMVGTVSQSITVGVVFAENLEVVISLSDNIFDINIYFNRHSLLNISCPIIIGLTTGTLEFTLLSYSSLTILWIFYHFCCDTFSARCVSATNHNYWFFCCKIEVMLAVEAIQLV